MSKKMLITCSIVFSSLFFSTFAIGQCYTVYYCSGCVSNGLCPASQSFATYEEALASAKNACPSAKPDIRSSNCDGPGPVTKRKVLGSPLGSGISGAMLGGLGFSLVKDANGNNQWALGAAGGYSFFSILSYIAEPKSRPLGVRIIFGALTGATGAYAGTKVAELAKNETTPAPETTKKDNTLLNTLIGGGTGALAGVVFGSKKTKGGYDSHIRRSKFMRNMAFTMSGNRAGIIIGL